MRVRDAACIGDLARIARRRLPPFAFDYLDGGAGEDRGVARNEARLRAVLLEQRHCVGGPVDTGVNLFGQSYAMPFGISPMGMANMLWPDTDVALARVAERERIPYVLSTAATTSIERIVEVAKEMAWFQLYYSRKIEINESLIGRAQHCGIRILVLTVDSVVPQKRNRNHRHGFDLPFRPHPRFLKDILLHPAWSFTTAISGLPNFENFRAYAGVAQQGGSILKVGRFLQSQGKRLIEWDDVARVRELWRGVLVVKGVMNAVDALRFLDMGVDGIWVSNHGGRQLEAAPATIDVLPIIRSSVPSGTPLLFDSGIRGGEDVVKACALGANMAFSGRSFGYGAAAGGAAGASKAFELLALETRYTLLQTGRPSISQVARDCVSVHGSHAPPVAADC